MAQREVLGILLIFLLVGCRWKKNFYEVDPGKFYRSAQLTGEEIREITTQYGIKTILNLRGSELEEEWYREEVQAASDLGVSLITIPMRADTIPHRDHILELLQAFEESERPILVHCKSGSDRTGEATAIYQMEYMNFPKEKALEESLRVRFLHFRLFTPAKSYFIQNYGGKKWVLWDYFPCFQEWEHYERPTFCPQVQIPAHNRDFSSRFNVKLQPF